MKAVELLQKPACKFCGVLEGMPDRKKRPAHINKERMCAHCYTLLNKVRYEPEKVSANDMEWFESMWRFNNKHGLYVPLIRRLQAEEQSSGTLAQCAYCGDKNVAPHGTHKTRCYMCGCRYIRYLNYRSKAKTDPSYEERLHRVELEYLRLMSYGCKVPVQILRKYGK